MDHNGDFKYTLRLRKKHLHASWKGRWYRVFPLLTHRGRGKKAIIYNRSPFRVYLNNGRSNRVTFGITLKLVNKTNRIAPTSHVVFFVQIRRCIKLEKNFENVTCYKLKNKLKTSFRIFADKYRVFQKIQCIPRVKYLQYK